MGVPLALPAAHFRAFLVPVARVLSSADSLSQPLGKAGGELRVKGVGLAASRQA